MNNRDLARSAQLSAQMLSSHPWSTKTNGRDVKMIARTIEALNKLAGDLIESETATRQEITRLEVENTRLKRESWEDGDRIQHLQKKLSDLRCSPTEVTA